MARSPVALLFDLDGTLVDSIPDLADTISAVLEAHGRRRLGPDEIRPLVGDGLRILLGRAFAATGDPLEEGALDRVVPAFTARYDSVSARWTRPYPGVVATLEQLAAAGHPMGLVTNKPHASTLRLVDALGLARFFGAIAGGDRHPFRKPDPRHPLAVLADLGGAPDRAVMVGDDPVDVAAGRAAGLVVGLATWGYARRPYDTLDADLRLARIVDLPDALARRFGDYTSTTSP